jgi:hypothetical protein
MITAITLENFKGIREPVTLAIRPITLLFGPNSAGKSTFLHALHYAYEIFENHNLDADLTLTGGPFVDLGGFKSLVHGRDYSQPVSIGFEVDMQQLAWVGFGGDVSVIGDFLDLPFRDFLASPPKSASVSLEIRWSPYEQRPYVAATTVSLNGEPFATLQCEPNLNQRFLRFLQTDLSSFTRVKDCVDSDDRDETLDFKETVFTRAVEALQPRLHISSDLRLAIAPSRIPDALPAIDEPFEAFWDDPDSGDSAGPASLAAGKDDLQRQVSECSKQFMLAVSELFFAPCQAVRAGLSRMLYLGPVREAPSRHERPRVLNQGQWATGRAAWDRLGECDEWLVNAVSEWLGDAKRLNTGYTVQRREFYEIDVDDPIVAALSGRRQLDGDEDERAEIATNNLGRFPISRQIYLLPQGKKLLLRPQDVGTGIAQVLPVVVALLDGKQRLICVEQPELHVHPKVQAGLADLVIEAAIGHRHSVFLETHSECLVLRLLRRVRETMAKSSAARERRDTQDSTSSLLRDVRPTDVAIYFITSGVEAVQCREIEVDDQGDFIQDWPDDFFEVDFKERYG